MHTTPPSPSPFTSAHWLALLTIAVLGGLQLYFHDVTFHGPDQIRDMEVVRRLIHQGEWPLNGPPLFGERFHLPPGFYYLLALPLLVWDAEASVFIAFGFAFALSVGYLWRAIAQSFGARCALIYAPLAFPIFASIYTHSAWNPALVMTFSNIVLALFLQLHHAKRHAGLVLPVALFLLVQIHLSAVPLMLGLGLFALVNHRKVLHRHVLVCIAALTALTLVWLALSGATSLHTGAAGAPASQQTQANVLERLVDVAKWRDAILMPYSAIQSLEPPMAALQGIAALQLAVTGAGMLLCLAFLESCRRIQWVLGLTVLWFAMSMAFLAQGALWHLDVIHPWIALLAAWGIARTCDKTHRSAAQVNLLALAMLVTALVGQWLLYSPWSEKGKYDLRLGLIFFPRQDLGEHKTPAYTYRHFDQMRRGLADHGICGQGLTGLEALVLGDATNRTLFANTCATAGTPTPARMRHFIAATDDAQQFGFTRGLQPTLNVGATAVYSVPDHGLTINGAAITDNLLSDRRLNYMVHLPAHLANGLRLALKPEAAAIVRVALRCGKDYPLEDPEQWRISGVQSTSFVARHVRYLGSVYYDLEWTLQLRQANTAVEIAAAPTRLDCDVSAIAREAASR